MPTLTMDAGDIEYTDSGGDGPVLVLLHGVNMSSTVWRRVIGELAPKFRCIAPTLPLGSHRHPMRKPEVVTHRGVARLVGNFIEALDLEGVTLVFNDWGGAQFLLTEGPNDRIAAAAFVACEAFENFPPGLSGRLIASSSRFRVALWVAMQLQRFTWFRRAPGGWGWMVKHPVPKAVMDDWFAPAQQSALIRRDLRAFALSTPSIAERRALSSALTGFDRPALVAWAKEDKLMPRSHGRRLAEVLPHGTLVELDDCYTVIPEDQPERLAEHLRSFVSAHVTS